MKTLTQNYVIESEHSARNLGSGEVQVLSTPSMILFMERTARKCVEPTLVDGYVTVGTRVDVRHLRPVPIGENLRVTARLTDIDGKRLTFGVKVEWRNIVVGEGVHERYVVNNEEFLRRLAEDQKIH